ncbi:MAG: gamma carbonic anhydrase family protein, partial [Deltaproteobacteria bacterium]|nr:gamma carbonic anhydrase family protein [Deltaproteobacteria bacterium]
MKKSALITGFGEHTPAIAPDAFVDSFVRIIGQVTIGSRASIWPGCVLRADDDAITVAAGAVVLDLALVEAPAGHPVHIGEGALVSHKACVHG